METTEEQVARKEAGKSSEIMPKKNLTRGEKKVRDSYLFCCENFYSLPEMINYMKENHGLPKTTVTNVFRELLKGRNAEAYLRVSQKRALQRVTLQRRASGTGVARSELGEFVEYDLDNEDDDWLYEFDKDNKELSPEMLESIIFKLEVLDHKTWERAGVITLTLGSPVPVLLQLDAAIEALQSLSINYGVFQAIFNYWKDKRKRWQKPILRRLQPPPPVNDTNPLQCV